MTYRVPDWFRDAKLGIIVHWGVPSVPAFAPADVGTAAGLLRSGGWPDYFLRCPHASWYANGMRLEGSVVYEHHRRHNGRHVAYERFARRFNEGIEGWDPYEWAELFAEAGARYVVLAAKDRDGFLMWPSERRPSDTFVAARDVVGELAAAVRGHSLKYGVSYSSLIDWAQQTRPVADHADLYGRSTPEYAAYVHAHLAELIDRYKPDLLLGETGFPSDGVVSAVHRRFRLAVPDGVVNDRWHQAGAISRRARRIPVVGGALARRARKAALAGLPDGVRAGRGDYTAVADSGEVVARRRPWELVRPIGASFGYNREEGPGAVLGGARLIHLLADVVSKNGNLLLGLGPEPDGTIPLDQRRPIRELAEWLTGHGEAIFNTRPWIRAEGATDQGVPIRFTTRANALYAILLDAPRALRITIGKLDLKRVPRPELPRGEQDEFCVRILGSDREIEWSYADSRFTFDVPGSYRASAAPVIKLGWRPLSRPKSDFYTDII